MKTKFIILCFLGTTFWAIPSHSFNFGSILKEVERSTRPPEKIQSRNRKDTTKVRQLMSRLASLRKDSRHLQVVKIRSQHKDSFEATSQSVDFEEILAQQIVHTKHLQPYPQTGLSQTEIISSLQKSKHPCIPQRTWMALSRNIYIAVRNKLQA